MKNRQALDEAELRATLLRRRLRGRRDDAPAVQRIPRAGERPLSFAQEQLWILQRLRQESSEYVLPVALRLTGQLDPAALANALRVVVDRHEILRSRIVSVNGEPEQVVDDPGPVLLDPIDMSAAGLAGVLAFGREETSRPFDLGADRPFRAHLLRLGPTDHVLLIVLHHVVFDGWSTDVLVRQLGTAYEAIRAGRLRALPEPELQYGDYAAWQRERMSGPRLDRELEHWRRYLDGATATELPTDKPRPARWDVAGATVSVLVPAELAQAVVELGRATRATPFMVFLATFKVLLARYAGTADVVVGTPVAGRSRPEVEDLVGFFVNTVVLRTQIAGDRPFTELVARVRESTLDAFSHQEVPFGLLVGALSPERELARNSLFQVMFALQTTGAAFSVGDLDGELLRVENDTAKFDLTWTLEERADGSYSLDAQFATALFEPATIERMTEHYLRLLDVVAQAPQTPVGTLDMLTEDERALVHAGPVATSPVKEAIPAAFAAVVADHSDAVALAHGDTRLTYAELDRRANRMAHHLVDLGVGPESLVAVLMERGPDAVVAMVAVLKAGAAYVPLDPAHPPQRLAYVLADTAARILITDRVDGLPESAARVVSLADADGCPDRPPGVRVDPDNLAYVIYTSGSTGRPKGVAVTHANVVRLFATLEPSFAFAPDDVWSCTHSYAFDFSVFETWGPLLHGGRCVIVDGHVARSPRDLLEILRTHAVTRLCQTPSAFAGLTELVANGVEPPAALRTVVFGGEELAPASLAPWFDRVGNGTPTFVNMYGITETTVHVTYREIGPGDVGNVRSPIGVPLPDLSLRVLDATGNPAGTNVPGEIHVGGPGLARGYLGRPALTAERFVPDPFSQVPGGRLYRSGDLARRTGPYDLEYLGRIDQQVKIRGFRIELGEVEAVLGSHPGVSVAAAAVHGEGAQRGLVGYVVPAHGSTPDVADLRAFMAERVPQYMIPAWWVQLPTLPATSTGKIDRRALPAPDGERPRLGHAYVAPRSDIEDKITRVWSDVLGVHRVGVDDNFFELGGDSIKAVRVAGRLAAAGIGVTVADVFGHQTVAALGAVTTRPDAAAGVAVAPFALLDPEIRCSLPAGVEDAYPVSAVQAGMLYQMLADRNLNLYHNVTSLFLQDDAPFDQHLLQAAADLLVARHEVLRTTFDLDTWAEPVQLVWPTAQLKIRVYDLRGRDESEHRATVERFAAYRRSSPLDLNVAPLLQLDVHRTADDAFWLSITECHAILDGWSHHSLIGDLMAEYRALRRGAGPACPPRRTVTRYADFIAVERAAIDSAEQRDFWNATLASAEPLAIPAAWAGNGDDHVDVMVPFADLLTGLREVARRAGTPLKSVLLAANLVALGEMSGQRRFRTGLVCNGRLERDGGDEVRGMFLNTVPIVADLTPASWVDLVRAVLETEVRLLPHRRFPLPVMKQLWPEQAPAPDVIFNYLDFAEVDDVTLDHSQAIDQSPNEAALHVSTEPGALVLTAHAARLAPDRLRHLGRVYRRVLAAMADNPDGNCAASFVPAAQARRLARWNDTMTGRADVGVLDRIAAQPSDATAVVCGDRRLTYGELQRRSNRIARHLQQMGVGPDIRVGVLLNRSVDLVTTLLGVLKSGGAYVPLDPGHPRQRLAYQLADAGTEVVLSESGLQERIPDVGADVVLLNHLPLGDLPDTPPVMPARPADLAYVIYTSGSTGMPKGVAVTREGLANLLLDVTDTPGMTSRTALLAVTTVAFDIAVLELFAPLTVGGTVVVADSRQVSDAQALTALLDEVGATMMQATPVTWQMLLDADWVPGNGFSVLCGGEKMPPGLADALAAAGATVWDMYGPTETTVWSMRADVTTRPGDWHPLANTAVHFLDSHLRPVHDGVPGEIHIGGAGLARGYLGRPGLTAERFVPDPFATSPGARMYRTGDLAVVGDAGVDILGRIDHQVKIRGFRIELEEVGAAVAAHPGVRAAVAAAHGTGATAGLAAYVVPRDGMPDPASLRAFVAERLPEYMVPSWWVELGELPVNASGKVDRRALPAPDGRRKLAESFVAPQTATAQAIAAVWAQVLGVDRVGVNDNFLDLGGHSLLALRVVGALRREHGLDVALRDLVTNPTVARLSGHLSARPEGAPRSAAAIWYRSEGDQPPLFCVHPGGGSGHWYEPLARALGERQPVAAFEWPGLNGVDLPLTSVDVMASCYLEELRSRYPQGPYRLLGWCGGSPVAWAMVHRLREAGEDVTFSLLDPVVDLWIADNFDAELTSLRRCEELLAHLVPRPPADRDPALTGEVVELMRQIVDDDRGRPIVASEVSAEWHRRVRVWRQMLEASIAYRFPVLPGPAQLILGDEAAAEQHEVLSGKPLAAYVERWSHLTEGDLTIVRVPGDHFGVLRPPHVKRLADALMRGGHLT
ncbi:amino acid adenylation domain-containing protein [Micromonospora sp. NPDC007220]|uniref:amino acid adenylation domain-containing protein n=1 Tax=Micromonospora sp. NPDC007220 TaxID=3154318 RepID=UPI0034045730